MWVWYKMWAPQWPEGLEPHKALFDVRTGMWDLKSLFRGVPARKVSIDVVCGSRPVLLLDQNDCPATDLLEPLMTKA